MKVPCNQTYADTTHASCLRETSGEISNISYKRCDVQLQFVALQSLLQEARIKPQIQQIEGHIYFRSKSLMRLQTPSAPWLSCRTAVLQREIREEVPSEDMTAWMT